MSNPAPCITLRGGSGGGPVLRDYQELICGVAQEYLRGKDTKESHFKTGASSSIKPEMEWFTGTYTSKPPEYDQFRRVVINQQRKRLIWNPTMAAYHKTGLFHILVKQLRQAIPRRGITPDALLDKVHCPEVEAETFARILHAAAVFDRDRDLFWSREMGPWDKFWRVQAGVPIQ